MSEEQVGEGIHWSDVNRSKVSSLFKGFDRVQISEGSEN